MASALKNKTIIIAVLVLGMILLFILSFLNRAGIKNVHNFSDSKQESRKNGFFISEYFPARKKIKLKLWPATVVLDSAWTEYPWTEEPKFLGSELRKTEGYPNLAVRVDTVTTTEFVYSLDLYNKDQGGIWCYNPLTKQHEGKLKTFTDTLRIILQEKNPVDTIGWIKPIVTDTIFYIRVKGTSH